MGHLEKGDESIILAVSELKVYLERRRAHLVESTCLVEVTSCPIPRAKLICITLQIQNVSWRSLGPLRYTGEPKEYLYVVGDITFLMHLRLKWRC